MRLELISSGPFLTYLDSRPFPPSLLYLSIQVLHVVAFRVVYQDENDLENGVISFPREYGGP